MTSDVSRELSPVQTRFFTFAEDRPFRLGTGVELAGPLTLAYETYGVLNPAADNAVLVFHAMTGSQHAAGFNPSVPGIEDRWTEECYEGWWDDFVGPGRAIDTDNFFVICANYLGGCYGSTGPASTNPGTGRPYGADFPRVRVEDFVDSQLLLLEHLGISKLRAVVGASIGGMMALSLATRYHDKVDVVVPIGSGLEVTTLQRILNFEQIFAIENDPDFRGGNYYDFSPPLRGLALARMIAHKTFVSLTDLDERAAKAGVRPDDRLSWYPIGNPMESYMLHQGAKFIRRFDANSYLRVLDAWLNFDLLGPAGETDMVRLFERCRRQNYLLFTIDSDVAFYPFEQERLAQTLKAAGVPEMRITVHSQKGHDSFLLEPHFYAPHLAHALETW